MRLHVDAAILRGECARQGLDCLELLSATGVHVTPPASDPIVVTTEQLLDLAAALGVEVMDILAEEATDAP